MLTFQDQKQVREIVKEELAPLDKKIDRIENNVDKVLKIVTRIDQEHKLTQARVSKLENRLDVPSTAFN